MKEQDRRKVVRWGQNVMGTSFGDKRSVKITVEDSIREN